MVDRKVAQSKPSEEELRKVVFEKSPKWGPARSEVAYEAWRKYFQVWNAERRIGGHLKRTQKLQEGYPLKCTVWRYRIPDWQRIFRDVIQKEIGEYYISAIKEQYPKFVQELREAGDERKIVQLKSLVGAGAELGVIPRVTEKARQSGTKLADAFREFYKGLGGFPHLQKLFLQEVIKDIYVDYSKPSTTKIKGYYTGKAPTAGPKGHRDLFTFFLMENPYPYVRTVPAGFNKATLLSDLREKYPEGVGPENPLPAGEMFTGPSALTFQTVHAIRDKQNPNVRWFIETVKNPDYDFMVPTENDLDAESIDQYQQMLRDKVEDLQRSAITTPGFFLAKNVLEESKGFGKFEGVRLLDLGMETPTGGKRISPDERDVTKLRGRDYGLFYIPGEGVPKEKPIGGGTPTITVSKRQLDLRVVQAFLETQAQETQTESGIWFDDEGVVHDSQEELAKKYDEESLNEFIASQLEPLVTEIVQTDLETGVAPTPAEEPEPELEEEEVKEPELEEELEEEIQPEEPELEVVPQWTPWGFETEEVPLPLAAKVVERLTKMADQLDKQGKSNEADRLDKIASRLVEKMINRG